MAERRQLASDILVDRSHDRYVFEQKVDWQQLIADKKAHENFAILKTLTNRDERMAYQLVKQYQQARIDTARAFEVYYRSGDADAAVTESQRQLAVNLLQVRNRLAAEIHQNHAGCEPFFEKLKINTLDLIKHANDYKTRFHLQKFSKEKARRAEKAAQLAQPIQKIPEQQKVETISVNPASTAENKPENKPIDHDLKNLALAFQPDEVKLLTHPDWQSISQMQSSPFVERLKMLDEIRQNAIKTTKEDPAKSQRLYKILVNDLKRILHRPYYKELLSEKMPSFGQFIQQHGKNLGLNITKGKDIPM